MSESKMETWLKAGYVLFGTEGLDGVRIERLARVLNLNKSGFYYYFKTMDGFLKDLLHYHAEIASKVAAEISRCETIDPDLLLLMVRHRSFFLVDSQLLVKSGLIHSHPEMDEAGKIITNDLLIFWRRNREEMGDRAGSFASLNIIRHFIYARIDPDNMTYEFLHELADETKKVFEKLPPTGKGAPPAG